MSRQGRHPPDRQPVSAGRADLRQSIRHTDRNWVRGARNAWRRAILIDALRQPGGASTTEATSDARRVEATSGGAPCAALVAAPTRGECVAPGGAITSPDDRARTAAQVSTTRTLTYLDQRGNDSRAARRRHTFPLSLSRRPRAGSRDDAGYAPGVAALAAAGVPGGVALSAAITAAASSMVGAWT